MDFKRHNFFEVLCLLRRGYGRYKWHILLMAILSFVGGILEGFGINAIIPLFSFVNGSQAGATDFISRTIQKFFIYSNLEYKISYLIIFIAVLFIFKAAFLSLGQYITSIISADYEVKTRGRLLKLTLGDKWSHLSKQKIGHLEQVLITNINYGAAMLSHISSFIFIISNLTVFSLLVINISFIFTIFTAIFGVIIYLVFRPWFYQTRKMSGEVVEKQKGLAHYVNESIIGMKSIKSMFVESSILERGKSFFERLKQIRVKIETFKNLSNNFLQPIGVLFILGAFMFFYKTGNLNFASFAVLIYAFNRLFSNIQYIQSWFFAFNSYIPHILGILSYEEEALRHLERDRGKKKFLFQDRLEFKNVDFAYKNEMPVLSGLNFVIKKGEIVGLIGPSGAGKTTIVDLLLRLLELQKGEILLDGENIDEIELWEWRRHNVGYVSQDIFLMNDTILNNIKFYNEQLNYDDIVIAAKMANIYDFIQSLPEKFETIVGERGLQLSGGQRQRIALARVLVKKPQILILDEATSSLDNESEMLIQKTIESLRGKITVITIAHRLSTVINFDKLFVLGGGKIVEQGIPKELLDNPNSYFTRLYNLKR